METINWSGYKWLLQERWGQIHSERTWIWYDPTAVNIDASLPEVIEEFGNNRGSSIIVIDEKNKPVGRILADDLVDALSNENEDSHGVAQGSGAL